MKFFKIIYEHENETIINWHVNWFIEMRIGAERRTPEIRGYDFETGGVVWYIIMEKIFSKIFE